MTIKTSMKSGIYIITSPSNKVYIGQTIDINSRMKHYKHNDCKNQTRLFNSLKFYGFEKHNVEFIPAAQNQLNILEQITIKYFDACGTNGLNCTEGRTNFTNVG